MNYTVCARPAILTVLTLVWVIGVFMVSQWAVLMWLYTLEHICSDKKQVKRDFMELKKY